MDQHKKRMNTILQAEPVAAVKAPGGKLSIAPPSNLPGNPGAKLWDQAMQGSDHTAQPGQPPMIPGGPESVIFADAGMLCSDDAGVLYVKTTVRTLATGWKAVTHA